MQKLLNSELDRKSIDEFRKASKYPVIVVLDNVRSLHNVGSVFRTCDAFLVEGLFLCGITGTPPHREIAKTALGATESVYWEYHGHTSDALRKLAQAGYEAYAVEQTVSSIKLDSFHVAKDKKYALVFGHEIRGVDQEVLDMCTGSIEIPQLGTKHSINVSVSAGIVLWEFFSTYRFLSSGQPFVRHEPGHHQGH